MDRTIQLFLDSFSLRFINIEQYHFDQTWFISSKKLTNSIFWLVNQGQIHLTVDNQRLYVKEGQLVLLPPNSIISCYTISAKLSMISINFEANVSFLRHRIWSEIMHFPIQHPFDMEKCGPIIGKMVMESNQSSIGQPFLLESGLQRLMGVLFNQIYTSSSGKSSSHIPIDARVQTVIEYLVCHPQRFPAVAELGDIVQLSESYLRKLFVEHTGLTPLQYMHELKMEHAKDSLLNSNDRISDIAYDLGYDDPNYFTRIFKKMTNHTPNEYRQRYRNWMIDLS